MAGGETARVVIIGGGAVGASCLYHLAKAGWTDCVLLEKNELTAGSTWHAAGNVPTFSTSWSIMNMQRYSTELYRGLGAAVDYPMNYHVTGSHPSGHSKPSGCRNSSAPAAWASIRACRYGDPVAGRSSTRHVSLHGNP